MPNDAFDQIKLAATTSMDFSAGLGIGAALSQAMKNDNDDASDEARDESEHLPNGLQ